MSLTRSSLLGYKLPFMPRVETAPITKLVMENLKPKPNVQSTDPCFIPAIAIATTIMQLLEEHVDVFLIPHLPKLNTTHKTTLNDLKMFNFGYTFILNTVVISALCKDTAKGSRERFNIFNSNFKASPDPLVWSMRAAIENNLNATINLYNQDPSAAFVFKYCEDYPFSSSPYFQAGMEVASIIFFDISQAVSDEMQKDPIVTKTWLHEWQGFSTCY